jgi:hypothetical protein
MMKQLIINADKSFIGAWFIDTAVCDKLVSYFESSNTVTPGRVAYKEDSDIINKDVKDSLELAMDPTVSVINEYDMQLHLAIEEYKKLYPSCNDTNAWGLHSANIQKYLPGGGFFIWHAERTTARFPACNRHLVFMTYLNDVNDGGETEFLNQNIKFKPQKGLTLIWPADWTHSHRGLVSLTETKYITTGWLNFID